MMHEAGLPLNRPNNVDIMAQRRTKSSIHFWLVRHLEWHDTERLNGKSRKILFTPRRGDIGNQVKNVVWAYALAVVTRRVLVIDWNFKNSNVLSERAKRRFLKPNNVSSASNSLARSHNELLFSLTANHIPVVTISDAHLGNPNMTVLQLFHIRWPDERLPPFEWSIRRAVAKSLFEPSLELNELLIDTLNKLQLCSYNDIHCNNNWWSSQPKKYYFAVYADAASVRDNLTRVAACFAGALRRHARHDAPVVYVSADSERWREVLGARLSEAMPRARLVHADWNGVDKVLATHAEQIIVGNALRVLSHRANFSQAAFLRGSGRYFSVVGNLECAEKTSVDFDSERAPPFW